MNVEIEKSWKDVLSNEFAKEYFKKLVDFVKIEYSSKKIYPKGNRIFSAFEYCSFDDLKVVILGQDPYHGANQANGLSFSVNRDVRIPPSLVNIYKELEDDLKIKPKLNGDLTSWAKQGVLLLNSTLTVEANKPGSHQNKGWEEFTDSVIKLISDRKKNIVFILWGAYAKKKGAVIDKTKHSIIQSPHPSPYSAYNGFFGSKPFSKTNRYLIVNGIKPINW